ncbi:MAG: 50S ribosomal protein L39e [Nitrososphaerota archaeon]
MARVKPLAKKLRLARAGKQNSNIPAWVVIRTAGRVRVNFKRRHWRRSRLQL